MLGLKKKFIRERSGIALLHCFSTKSLQKKMCPKFQISSVHVSLLQVHVLPQRIEQDESIALKDVVFQKITFKNCAMNVTVSKKE